MLRIALLVFLGFALWYAWERMQRRTRPMSGGLHADITLPHKQEFELYHNALSLCSKKARLCLAELGIDYKSHHIDLIETGSYENISRHFLRVNPAGLVPVLVHDGHPIYESHDIIRYAADHAPQGSPSLLPSDAARLSEMQQWVDRASLTGDDPIADMASTAGNCIPGLTVPLFAAMIEDIPTGRIIEGLLFHRLKIRPLLFLALKAAGLHRLPRLGRAARIIQESARQMSTHLDDLETQLGGSGGPWILGDEYTLADVSWCVIFDRLDESDCAERFLGAGKRPLVEAYHEHLEQRPSYEAAITDFAHPAVTAGTARIQLAKMKDETLRHLLDG